MTGSGRCVALLPMKANSQRVKGKNFRPLHGKPLFRWILDALLAIDEIDEVVINTDARHILAENGLVEGGRVRIRDRKPELCGDTVSMNLILADDIAAVPADTLVIHGEADDVVPLAAVLDWARPQSLPVTVVPGVGHFFHGQLPLLKDIVLRGWHR